MQQTRHTNHSVALRDHPIAMRLANAANETHAYFQPPNLEELDPDFRRLVHSVIWALITVALAMLPLAGLNVVLGLSHATVCMLLTIPPAVGLLCIRSGYVAVGINSVMVLCLLGVDGLVLVSGGPTSSSAHWLVLVPMLTLAILPPRAGFAWLCVMLANQLGLLLLFDAGLYSSVLTVPGQELPEFATNFVFAPVVAALMASGLAVVRDAMTDRLASMESDVRLVLDNVPTGFVVVDRSGRLADRPSQGVLSWLGEAAAGDDLLALIAKQDPDNAMGFRVAFEALVEEALPIDLLLEQMPKWWFVGDIPYRLSFFLVCADESAPWSQLAITVRDARNELRRQAAEAERDALAAIVRLLQSERDAFLDFVEESDRLVLSLQSELEREGWLRALHTLKGSAAVFGLARLSTVCHEAEQLALAGDRVEALRRVEQAWSAWREVFNELVDEGGFDGVRLEESCYREFLALLQERAAHDQLLHAARLWTYQRVRRALERVASRAAAVAERLGKPVPIVVVDSPDLRVDRARWRPLWTAMIHLVRNAVDHGFESPVDRRRSKKSAQGTLTLRAWLTEESIVLEVADDGAGIDWERVRSNAAALGLPTDGEQSVSWLIADGVSTRDRIDEVSGRGVGLASLAEAVEALDGVVSVTTKLGQGTEWRLTIPRARMHPDDETRATNSAVLRALAA